MSSLVGGWVALWSPQQKAFHVESTNEMLRKNIKSCMGDKPNEYICVAIVNSREEAHECIKKLKESRKLLGINE